MKRNILSIHWFYALNAYVHLLVYIMKFLLSTELLINLLIVLLLELPNQSLVSFLWESIEHEY